MNTDFSIKFMQEVLFPFLQVYFLPHKLHLKTRRKLFLKIPCGSISNGHLLELLTMMPLSTEKESTGRPAMFQARILTGSPRVVLRENVSEQGIIFS